jgi:hypothetical protein
MILPLIAVAVFARGELVSPDALDRSRLPADVDLVVHIDLEGLRSTQIWRFLEDEVDIEAEIGELDEVRERFGVDLVHDVKSVTIYKTKGEEDPTAALLRFSPVLDQALSVLEREPGYRAVTQDGIPLHSWSDGGEESVDAYAYVHALAGGDRMVVFSERVTNAVEAARVLRGEARNLAQSKTPALAVQPAPGSFLYVSASEFPGIEDTPASQLFGLAQGIQLDLGEAGGFLNVHAAVTTEQAQDVAGMLNGMIAMGNLVSGQFGEASEVFRGLLRAVRVSALGSEVTVDFQYSVQALLEDMRVLEKTISELEAADEAESEHSVEHEVRIGRRGGRDADDDDDRADDRDEDH